MVVEGSIADPAFWSIARKVVSRIGLSRGTNGTNEAEKGSTAGILLLTPSYCMAESRGDAMDPPETRVG
jgi:hypothetical protein